MGRFRWSIRTLLGATLLVGFDCAAMIRAVQQGRLANAVAGYAAIFGAALFVFNASILGFAAYFSRLPAGRRWTSAPPTAVIGGLYLAMVALAVLSALFLTSGRF